MWIFDTVLNAVVSVCFFLVAASIGIGLRRSGQMRTNRLGVITAAIFTTCALGHAAHAAHMLLPFAGIDTDEGLAQRAAIDVHMALIDFLTATVAVLYWVNRRRVRSALTSGALFADLQQRYEVQERKLESTARVATVLQQSLTPDLGHVTDGCSFDALYVPSEIDARVGGDWYDAFQLPDGRVALAIGDVTGHGVEAAAATMRVREALGAIALESPDPGSALTRANRVLCVRNAQIVTVFFGIFDAQTGILEYSSAGHPAPLLVAVDAPPVFLTLGGLPLGVELSSEFETRSVALEPGALLVAYTDGLTEIRRDLFSGESSLVAGAQNVARRYSVTAARTIFEHVVGANPIRDDVALLLLRFVGVPDEIKTSFGDRFEFNVTDPAAASLMRRRVMSYLAATTGEYDLQIIELILGELLGNVARHAPGMTVVEARMGERLELSVSDCGSGLAWNPRVPDDFSEGGRGMFIVSQLTSSVATACAPEGGTTIRVAVEKRSALV